MNRLGTMLSIEAKINYSYSITSISPITYIAKLNSSVFVFYAIFADNLAVMN